MNDVHFSSTTAEWATPQDFFNNLDDEFRFTLDPCSTDENAKCAKHYTKEQDGLAQDWTGETVFCNPPYGREMPKWIRKCYEHFIGGGTAVMLIPARTDTKAFHEYIYGKAEIRFVKGRLKFGGSQNSAPFPSMVVVYKNYNGAVTDRDKAINGLERFIADLQPYCGNEADWRRVYDALAILKEETEGART